MFAIVIYDVASKKDTKVLKLLRKYLIHVQKSVFEGELTPAQLKLIKEEISRLNLDHDTDSVLIYTTLSDKAIQKHVLIGEDPENYVLGFEPRK